MTIRVDRLGGLIIALVQYISRVTRIVRDGTGDGGGGGGGGA